MCRSKNQGGRRCDGMSRSAGSAREQYEKSPMDKGLTPEQERAMREQVDALARQLPSTRRGWDGSPLNDKDRRFFALRDAGYNGPIDQDGYPDTTSEAASILRRMAKDRGGKVNW